MAINKITPRGLDKSTDQRLVPATAFIDAVNAVIEDSGLNGDGNAGVIKNANSNEQVVTHTTLDAVGTTEDDVKIIGSVVDHKLKLVYLFVKNSNEQENGVWVYDPYGKLSLPTRYAWEVLENESGDQGAYQDGFDGYDAYAKNTLKCVAKGAYFDFDEHSVVQGNVVYGNTLNVPTGVAAAIRGESGSTITVTESEKSTFEKDFHLYFTDNKSEPRKINVVASMFSFAIAAKMGPENQAGVFTSDENGIFMLPQTDKEKILFSYACRPTPLKRPSFIFNQDESSEENNFVNSPGFKFAYQITFLDGTKSAISPKSKLAFIPSVLYQGKNKTPDHSQYNNCQITIFDDYLSNSPFVGAPGAPYVKEVSILAQEGDGPFNIVKKVSSPIFPLVYNFRNDVIGITVPSSEENKFFDSVPQKAEAQAVVDNRLMYGNYVDGLPKHSVDASLSVIFKDRPSENYGTPIKIESTIALDSVIAPLQGEVPQKQSGFRITVEDGAFPAVESGDLVNLKLKFLPNRNFHVYNSSNSYHQSRQWGVKNEDDIIQNLQYYQTPEQAGIDNLVTDGGITNNTAINFLGDGQGFTAIKDTNNGVASAVWTPVDGINGIPSPYEIKFGTSAAHPFIIPSSVLTFSLSVKCILEADADTLRDAFFDIFDRVVAGLPTDNTSGNQYFNIENYNKLSDVSWDLPLENFQRFEEGSSLSKLICTGSAPTSTQVGGTNISFGEKGRAYVIPKKGNAVFRLKKAKDFEIAPDPTIEDSFTREYKIMLDHVKNDIEFWTCLRKWKAGSPWWVIDPEWVAGVGDTNDINDFYNQSQYSIPSYASDYQATYLMDIPGVNDVIQEYIQNPTLDFDFGEYLGTVFTQQNRVWDFVIPSSVTNAVFPEVILDVFSPSNYNKNDIGHLPISTSGIVGFVKTVNTTLFLDRFIIGEETHDDEGTFLTSPPGGGAENYSIMDGEGGPGGSLPPDQLPDGFQFSPDSLFGRNPAYNGVNFASSAYGHCTDLQFFGPYFTGRILSNARFVFLFGTQKGYRSYFNQAFTEGSYNDFNKRVGPRTIMPMIQGIYNGLFTQSEPNADVVLNKEKMYSNFKEGDFEEGANGNGNPKLPFSFSIKQSFIEQFGAASFEAVDQDGIATAATASPRSFKTRSDHEFGVVFYDKLGRRSFVNPIGSVYVPGYSDAERGGEKGAVAINVNIDGDPPSWASKYQILYGGNKTSGDFIQYTTNNAYIENTNIDQEDINLDEGKMYVSLNTLQSSSISYAKEFGARGEDQGMSIYKFSDGDKLRIISYGQENERIYPKNYLFDVISVEYFDPLSGLDANPLIDTGTPESKFFGEFVVIRNNASASGFTYEDILSGSSLWNRNVAFEIFSPVKATGIDTQVYQEVGDVYNIKLVNPQIGPSAGYAYAQNSIDITEGDVFFRPVAVNLNKFETNFEDLFEVDQDITDNSDELKSNFNNLFLESASASNLVPSKIKNFGRFNVESENAKRVRREAGIIYSEKSNPESDKLNYSSFNASLFPYKDLEERFGNINFMDEIGGNLFVIQQDRCTMIPVSSTILTNAVGQEQLIASNEILGKERVYSAKAGCDNNPESVVRVDNTFYFAHKSTGKVFRFVDGQGIEEISDVNMASYFREIFDEAIAMSQRPDLSDVRVVGGYEPIKQEYLLTILTPEE